MLRSVRARTTLGATAVVAGALIVAGLAVVLLLRADLAGRADLQSEVAAREVASQLATGVTGDRLDLPDPEDHPVLVVDASGRVRAADKDLRDVGGVPVRPSARIPPGGDDHGDDDDDDSRPGRGQVSPDVDFSTATATVDGRTAEFRFASVRVSTPAGETLTVRAGASLATTREAVGTVARAMLVGLPVLLAVVAGVTWLVTRRALGPVEAIRAQMAAITASGDLTRRVPEPGSRDEVADLAVTTNATLAALEESVGRQRGFVADASHELRSPIASLRTQLEVALAHPELLDLEGVVEDVVRLQHLAADLLLLARLDAGTGPPRPRPGRSTWPSSSRRRWHGGRRARPARRRDGPSQWSKRSSRRRRASRVPAGGSPASWATSWTTPGATPKVSFASHSARRTGRRSSASPTTDRACRPATASGSSSGSSGWTTRAAATRAARGWVWPSHVTW